MSILEIISLILNFVLGGGLITLFTLNSSKRKANYEADSVAIDTMKDALKEIRESNDNLIKINQDDKKKIDELNNEIVELTQDNVTACMLICKHSSCPFREPERGLGRDWLKKAKEEGHLVDTKPITDIALDYGFTLERRDVKYLQKT